MLPTQTHIFVIVCVACTCHGPYARRVQTGSSEEDRKLLNLRAGSSSQSIVEVQPLRSSRERTRSSFNALKRLELLLRRCHPAAAFNPSATNLCPVRTSRPAMPLAGTCFARTSNPMILAARASRAPQPIAFFDNGEIGPLEIGIGVALALLALSQVGAINAVVPLLLIFLGGDPDEREKAGANDNAAVKALVEKFTPSAWKKAYLGENDVERGDNETVLLDLPKWQGEDARALVEEEAVENLKSMQMEPIDVPGVGIINTCFISLKPEPSKAVDAPPLFLIHGFDSSVLEFRYVAPKLAEAGLRVEAMEWWTGGFTDRKPILEQVEAGKLPWDLIRDHLYAYWKKQLNGQKVVLLGASLGGAAAIDFAVTHPECVEGMVLMDAGGESYAQPDPFLTSLCADPVTNFFQWRANNGLLPYPQVWWKENLWRASLRGYLKSGGYGVRVNPELIRQVPVPTKVLWGEEDDVLPVEDAYKYEKDLPNCVGVQLIPDAQHAPALENPEFVVKQLIDFAKQMGQQRASQPA